MPKKHTVLRRTTEAPVDLGRGGRGRPRRADPLQNAPTLAVAPMPPAPPVRVTETSAVRAIAAPADRTETPYGSILSRRLALRYCMTHPIGFREYMIPVVSPRGYWHRYAFSPVILAARQGDTQLEAGRASGKSFSVLEPEIVQHALTHPGEETLLTSLRKVHIVDRMERVIDYLEHAKLARYIKSVKRSPVYMVSLHGGHIIYGISVGDDPEARMAQGKHASLLVVEEGHQYPLRAWTKIQGAKDMRGCRVLMIGVPDGRIDTPYRMAREKYPAFEGRRFRISARTDPNFTQKTKREKAVTLGGIASDLFKQEVDAEWGAPAWSAWDLQHIYKCLVLPSDEDERYYIPIDKQVYVEQGWSPLEALIDVTVPANMLEAAVIADIGYTEPTEVGIFVRLADRRLVPSETWRLLYRIEFRNRMEHNTQAEILWELCVRFRATLIGLDTTEGEGRAIAQELDLRAGRVTVTRVVFNENIPVEEREDEDGKRREITELAKSLGTRLLREMFASRAIALPRDEVIPAEFNREMELKTPNGQTVVRTPPTVHIPDMMRVFVITLFQRRPEAEAAAYEAMPEFEMDPTLAMRESY